MKRTQFFALGFSLLATTLASQPASAGYFEVSGNGSYSKYDNGLVGNVNSTSINQRWGAGLAYRFLSNTAIELSYTDSKSTDRFGQQDAYSGFDFDFTKVTQIQNTSLDLVLDFADRKARFRPFIRGGGGYMTRQIRISGTRKDRSNQETTPLTQSDPRSYSASATGGLGFKIFIADAVAIETSGNVYVTDLDKPDTYVHYSATAGLRLLF